MVQVSQNVEVGGTLAIGRTYRVSAWMKTTGLDMPNGIMLGTFTKQIRPTGSWRIAMPPKQSDWTRGEATFTVPEGSELLRIMLHVTGRGTVWLDDLKLEEILADRSVVEVQRPDKPQDHRLMHRWVELFHGDGQPYLLLGRMLHPPKLEVRTCESHGRRFPAILHNAFAAPDGLESGGPGQPHDHAANGQAHLGRKDDLGAVGSGRGDPVAGGARNQAGFDVTVIPRAAQSIVLLRSGLRRNIFICRSV